MHVWKYKYIYTYNGYILSSELFCNFLYVQEIYICTIKDDF